MPLESVATIEPARGWGKLVRIDGRRSVTVTGDVDPAAANAMEIIAETRAEFLPRLRQRYPDLTVAVEGQAEASATTGQSVARGFLIGLLVSSVLVLLAVPALYSILEDLGAARARNAATTEPNDAA